MDYKVKLTDEQRAILEGSKGETLAKVMESLVRYGELFGATEMVPISSKYNHLVTSFGLKALGPVYELMDKLLEAGAPSGQKFTVDPKPLDKNVPSNFAQDVVFKLFMYSRQKDYEKQLADLGLLSDNAFTCTCYMDEVGNKPGFGEVLSWSESSAVVYANSVLGARCNRNSGIIDLMGSVIGYVPKFGLLTDEGRKADWIVEIKTTKKPEAQLLGSAIGMKVMEDVPYVKGLDKWLGTELDDEACTYLKDFGAATASNGAVGLYHIDKLTPEAAKYGESLIKEGAKVYVVDDEELERKQHEVGPRELQPLWWPQVENTHDEAKRRSDSQGEIGSTCGGLLPENTKYEDCSHWGSNESQYRLEDVKKIKSFDGVYGHCQDNSQGGTYDSDEASDVIDMTLRCVGVETLDVDVHCEYG